MLPTFVIGLREGLEAALIVGIIAAFLGSQGRRDALRQMWIGVVVAVVLCIGVGVALRIVAADLPHKAQEGLETIVGSLAVVMVTGMVVWMRKHARGMKKELEGAAADALAKGSAFALVAMAFLAVLREGFETAVFVIAVLNQPGSTAGAGAGVVLGILLAVVVGWGIFQGGLRLNLAKFFKVTGVVLVLVAAGLIMTVFHSAFEAGWVTIGQAQALDLAWLVHPGTPLASLLTGVLGLRPELNVIQVVAWLVYAIPVGALVLVTPKRRAAKPAPAHSATPSVAVSKHAPTQA